MKLLWLSDIHLNFLRKSEDRENFYLKVKNENADHIVITGDIAESHNVIQFVTEMEYVTGVPVHFVLGNHDFYGSSIKETRKSVMHLNYLRRNTGTPLSSTTILIGVDGWGDCRNGDYENSRLTMSDWLYIEELNKAYLQGPVKLKRALQKIADTDAKLLAKRVIKAIGDGFSHIIIATHVPPFENACMNAGRKSTPGGLCFFSSKILGDMIKPIAEQNSEVDFLWLCGHTHSKVSLQVLNNLVVNVAHSEYYYPTVAGVIEYEL
jgi:predicted phosphohydrolase